MIPAAAIVLSLFFPLIAQWWLWLMLLIAQGINLYVGSNIWTVRWLPLALLGIGYAFCAGRAIWSALGH